MAILRAGISARLDGAGPEAGARAAEYHLRVLGMTAAEAHKARLATDKIANAAASLKQ
ncbi:MAG: hypothetical protein ACKOVA_16025 [Novosphingobium sp.]